MAANTLIVLQHGTSMKISLSVAKAADVSSNSDSMGLLLAYKHESDHKLVNLYSFFSISSVA